MPTNSRYAVALHILVALAFVGSEGATSEQLARSVNTNPVVVRRILGTLVKAGIVHGRGGRGGGYRLAREPRQIGLDVVLTAIEPDGLFTLHENAPNRACTVSCNIKSVLGTLFAHAESALHAPLRATSVADLLRQVQPPA